MADRKQRLSLTFTADGDGLLKFLDRAGGVFTRLDKTSEQAVGRIVKNLERLETRIQATAVAITQSVRHAGKALDSLGRGAGAAGADIKSSFADTARNVTASTQKIVADAGKATKAGANLRKAETGLKGLDSTTASVVDKIAKNLERFETKFHHTAVSVTSSVVRARKAMESLGKDAASLMAGVPAAFLEVEKRVHAAMQQIVLDASRAIGAMRQVAKVQVPAGAAGPRAAPGAKAASALGGFKVGAQSAEEAVTKAFFDMDNRTRAPMGRFLDRILSIRAAIASLALGASVGAPIKLAADFQEQVANINTLLEDNGAQAQKYRDQLLNLAEDSSKGLIDLSSGLYQVLSAGIPAVEGVGGAFDVLTAGQKAATAGLSTTEEAVKGLTTVLNIYRGAGLSAADVSDKLFTVVVRGVTTFPELAGSIGQVLGVSKAFGVSLDETLGVLTALTKAGFTTSEAVSSLRQALVSISRGGSQADVKEYAKKLGIEFNATALETKGFLGVLADVEKVTGGSASAISGLFTDIDGLKGVLALTSQGLDAAAADVDALGKSAGATDRAYEKLAGTFNVAFGQLKNKVSIALIEIGDRILPKLASVMERIGAYLLANKEGIASALESVADALFAIGEFVAAHGTTILTFFAALFAADKIAGAAVALGKFAKALQVAGDVALAGKGMAVEFMSGFQRGVSGLPAFIVALLKSPGFLGLIAAAALTIGTLLADVIGQESDKAIADAKRKAREARRKELDVLADDSARKRGFTDAADEDAKFKQYLSGELLSAAGGGKFQANALTDAQGLVDSLGYVEARKEAFANQAELALRATEFESRSTEIGKQILVAQISRERAIKAGAVTAARELAEQITSLQQGRQGVDDLARLARQGERSVVAAVEGTLAAANKAKTKIKVPGKGKDGDAEALLRARLQYLSDTEKVEREIAGVRIAAEEAVYSARTAGEEANQAHAMRLMEERHEAEMDLLRGTGATEEQLRAAERKHADEMDAAALASADARKRSLQAESALVSRITDARIAAMREETDAAIREAQRLGREIAAKLPAGSTERRQLEDATRSRTNALEDKFTFESAAVRAGADERTIGIESGISDAEANRRQAQARQNLRDAEVAAEKASQSFVGRLARGIEVAGDLLERAGVAVAETIVDGLRAGVDVVVRNLVAPIERALSAPLDTLLGGLIGGIDKLLDLEIGDGEAFYRAAAQLEDALDNAQRLIERLAEALPELARRFMQAVTKALPGLVVATSKAAGEVLRVIAEEAGGLINAVIDALIQSLPIVIDALVDSIPIIVDALLKGVERLLTLLPEIVTQLFEGIITLLDRLFPVLAERLGGLITALIRGVLGAVRAIIDRLPELVQTIVRGLLEVVAGIIRDLPKILTALIDELLQLIVSIARVLPEIFDGIVAGVIEALPSVIDALPGMLEGVIAELVPALIGSIGDAILSSLEGPAIGDALVKAGPKLAESIALLIPRLAVALYTGFQRLLSGFWEDVKSFFSSEFMEALGTIIYEAVVALIEGIGEAVADAVKSVGDGFSNFGDALIGGDAGGFGGAVGRFVGKTTGLSALGKIARGDFEDLEVSDVPVVGGAVDLGKKAYDYFFGHSGGTVRASARNPALANTFRALGAQAFAGGGIVRTANSAMRMALGAPFMDDVPAILQAGERVLSRQEVARAGGPGGVEARLQGQGGGPPAVRVEVQTNGGAVDALVKLLIDRIVVEAETGGSAVRRVLDQGRGTFGYAPMKGRG